MRRTIQLLFLGCFIYLFFCARYPLTSFIPVDLFLRADPLVAFVTSLSSRELVPHLLLPIGLLLLTLVLGRFFCGYLCPLGTVLDLSQSLFTRARVRFTESLRSLKLYILIGLVAAALTGTNLLYLFDPISILTRTFTILLYPLTVLFANLSLDLLRPAARELGWIRITYLRFEEPLFFYRYSDRRHLHRNHHAQPHHSPVLVPVSLSPRRASGTVFALRHFQAGGY